MSLDIANEANREKTGLFAFHQPVCTAAFPKIILGDCFKQSNYLIIFSSFIMVV